MWDLIISIRLVLEEISIDLIHECIMSNASHCCYLVNNAFKASAGMKILWD